MDRVFLVGGGGGEESRYTLKGTNMHQNGHIWVNNFQIESMVEIYSKCLIRAIGKVLLMKFS